VDSSSAEKLKPASVITVTSNFPATILGATGLGATVLGVFPFCLPLLAADIAHNFTKSSFAAGGFGCRLVVAIRCS
jgi:hypothetical protein